MELTITEPIFVWLLTIAIALEAVLVLIVIMIGWYLVKLLRFVDRKSEVVGEAIDEVRSATHEVSESLRDTSQHVAQFVNFITSAAGIAKLFSAAREAWTSWSGKRTSKQSRE